MNSFRTLGIQGTILKAIEDRGFKEPTIIQQKTIPAVVRGRDIIAGSKTGSGKTLAFAIGVIHAAEKGRGVQGIVLTPTRELAEQVTKEFSILGKYKSLKVTSIYGGTSINNQIREIKRTEIVVGTPGRILDHLQRGTLNLQHVKVAVLDEADRMLDMGFIDDVHKILSQCPRKRQTLLYSATISSELAHLAERHLHDPIEISVANVVDPAKLKQVFYEMPDNLKISLLVHLLKEEKSQLVMIFCNTRRTADFVARNLKANSIKAMAIHGGYSQAKRTKTMEDFHGADTVVLVCTDVAARGLHIEDVTHVYNYDIPRESKQYIHRIGRTARAGEEGKAISFLTRNDFDNFDRVLQDSRLKIERKKTPYVKKIIIKKSKERRNKRSRFRRFH